MLLSVVARAQTYTESILYNFTASDGVLPNGLVMDTSGNLYGTMSSGPNTESSIGNGLVYELSASGVFTILHSFTGVASGDGAVPAGALTIDKSSNLYGTTTYGGLGSSEGYGTVFKITAAGKYSILHKFTAANADGNQPNGPVTLDSAGNIYGTTVYGGKTTKPCQDGPGCGMIYKITSKGVESVVYKFQGYNQTWPVGNLLRDSEGNFYGINLADVVYEVTAKGAASILYNFDTALQVTPWYYIARSADGTFYGAFAGDREGYDSVSGIWQYDNGTETNFYFCENCTGYGSPEGAPLSGPLLLSGGNVYGTAGQGGAYWEGGGDNGGGDVYEYDPSTAVLTLLHSFPNLCGGTISVDGGFPQGGVIADTAGNLYGTTVCGGSNGQGIIFKLTKN
jgi:uncharacterized repeat protein (TIGR03803 family)